MCVVLRNRDHYLVIFRHVKIADLKDPPSREDVTSDQIACSHGRH